MQEVEVVLKVKECAAWWVNERQKKLRQLMSNTMTINPFMMPFLFDFHSIESFDELIEQVIAKHLMTGHDTGFGKLIDEKILPRVFNAQKLDKAYRTNTAPYDKSCFDEIDHIITRPDGTKELLSLKAGKWTIQLTMAVQLNRSFEEIITEYPDVANKIVVGVFYGKPENLTDKYRLLRGINTGANHDVVDLTDSVFVESGKGFWSWLNNGEEETQEWVLRGISEAVEEANIKEENVQLIQTFKEHVIASFDEGVLNDEGIADWKNLLIMVNG